jgi:hypothetical protein
VFMSYLKIFSKETNLFIDIIELLVDLILVTKKNSFDLISSVHIPIYEQVLKLIDNMKYDQSLYLKDETIRQKIELQKSYLKLLKNIICEVPEVYISKNNISYLFNILDFAKLSAFHIDLNVIF